MKRKIKNILDIVANVSKCDLCYILHVDLLKGPRTIGLKNKNGGIVPFNQFNKELVALIRSGTLSYSEIANLNVITSYSIHYTKLYDNSAIEDLIKDALAELKK